MTGITGFRSFNNSSSKRALNLLVLEMGYLRLRKLVVRRLRRVIKFGVHNGGINGVGSLGIEVRPDTGKLTNVDRDEIWSE